MHNIAAKSVRIGIGDITQDHAKLSTNKIMNNPNFSLYKIPEEV